MTPRFKNIYGSTSGYRFKTFFVNFWIWYVLIQLCLLTILKRTFNMSNCHSPPLPIGLFVDVDGVDIKCIIWDLSLSYCKQQWNASFKTLMYMLVKYNWCDFIIMYFICHLRKMNLGILTISAIIIIPFFSQTI